LLVLIQAKLAGSGYFSSIATAFHVLIEMDVARQAICLKGGFKDEVQF
jgi:hypothetical protein